MYDNIAVYKIWAPDDALWTPWVKPVLFSQASLVPHTRVYVPAGGASSAALHNNVNQYNATSTGQIPYNNIQRQLPSIEWLSQAQATQKTMLIVDLPGGEGVLQGLALAKEKGFRPIPLYNGVNGPNVNSVIVNVQEIVQLLFNGADFLSSMPLAYSAPPVFLLDANRMSTRWKQPGKFDNRWCVFAQDMPSAPYLIQHGIENIIVRTDNMQNDLTHVLRRYQDKGLKILVSNKNGQTKAVTVAKPSQFKSLLYRCSVTMGLTRNATGGFGGIVPEPSQSGGVG